MKYDQNDQSAKHRVIGIRYALKVIREAGLIPYGITHPDDAVIELSKTLKKADSAKRFRSARGDSTIPAMKKNIEAMFNLPPGSVNLVYPSGRKAPKNAKVANLRKKWDELYM